MEWKLVPIEPTAAQTRAGQLGVTTTCANAIYAAMLAAAPQPVQEPVAWDVEAATAHCDASHYASTAEELREHKVPQSALQSAIEAAVADEKQNPWKRAVTDALVVNHIFTAEHEKDADKALAALVDWECVTALDPAVSREAAALMERGAEEARAACIAAADTAFATDHVLDALRARSKA